MKIAQALPIVWAALAGHCATCGNEGPPEQYDDMGLFPLPSDVRRCVTCKAPLFRCVCCSRLVSWSTGSTSTYNCAECACPEEET